MGLGVIMNKKQIIKAITFIGGFLLILQTVTYVIRTNGGVKDRFTGFYAEKNDTLDVVMIGSSPVYPCFAGAKMWGEYGFTAYPLASNMQRPMATLSLVKEVRKTQNPEVFVFEMKQYTASEEDMSDNMAYTRGVTDNMKYSWNRIDAINRMVPELEERYTYYFDIFKYHSNWKTMVLPSQLACFNYEKLDPLKGFEFKDSYYPMSQVDYSEITDTVAIEPVYETALRELLAYLKENNLQALFIVAPYSYEFADKQRNYNYMDEIIRSYGFEFLNLTEHTEDMGFDFATDFYDKGVHTNPLGAEKATEFLALYLKNHFNIPDKRGKKEYQTWDEAFLRWETQMEKSRAVTMEKIKNKDYEEPEIED